MSERKHIELTLRDKVRFINAPAGKSHRQLAVDNDNDNDTSDSL